MILVAEQKDFIMGEISFRASRARAVFQLVVVAAFLLLLIPAFAAGLYFGGMRTKLGTGDVGAWLVVAFLPLIPMLLFDLVARVRDHGPNLVLGEAGFSYRWANHDFGFFPWSEVVNFTTEAFGIRRMLLVTIADRKLIKPRIGFWRLVITALGFGAILLGRWLALRG